MGKLFTVAGYSNSSSDGRKARFANSPTRARVLHYAGDTDISLYTLPQPMTKADATAWLNSSAHLELPQIVYTPRGQKPALRDHQQANIDAITATVSNPITIESALEQVPVREKGRFLSKERRMELAQALVDASV